MTAEEFRRLALSFPEATEGAHMDHPEIRVGMVKLFPDQQKDFVRAEPEVFAPVNGLWGRRGATYVRLKIAKKGSVRRALAAAWRNTAPKGLAEKFETTGRGKGWV